MKLTDIKFRPRIKLEEHPRYSQLTRLIGLRDFSAYREVFERGWAETSILCGEFVRLEELPVEAKEDSSLLSKLMGLNEHALRRIELAKEFFTRYQEDGRSRFLKKTVFETEYAQDLFKHTDYLWQGRKGISSLYWKCRQKQNVQNRILSFLDIYDAMKTKGDLAGTDVTDNKNNPVLKPEDLPWAIDYGGYIKLRDGSHRRAIAYALGWKKISTLVFEFHRIDSSSLEPAHPYICDNFTWFKTLIQKAALNEFQTELVK